LCRPNTSRGAKAGKKEKEKTMNSIQTNTDSLIALQNLNLDNQFQSNTIQQLTSGYRINNSGDDAAGLAIANQEQSNISQLNQGVLNANNGTSQLQIVDGGMSNISTILNRMQTLATESASGTFTGSRATLNQEYSGLVSEITRQASNIGLNAGGALNSNLNVFIGGAGSNTANASVNIDLSGAKNAVDATSLGLVNTNVLGGGGGSLSGNTVNLNAPNETFMTTGGDTQTYTFQVYNGSAATAVTATLTNAGSNGVVAGGFSAAQAISSLNSQLSAYGITAGTASNGTLQFTGASAFSVTDSAALADGSGITNGGATSTAENTSNNIADGAASYTAPAADTAYSAGATAGQTNTETMQFQTSSGEATVTLTAANAATQVAALATINAKTAALGIYAIQGSNGGISLQGANTFTVNDTVSQVNETTAGVITTSTGGAGVFAATPGGSVIGGTSTNATVTPATTDSTGNATAAITAINNAIAQLGLAQGVVGAGENTLNYATNLAQSQITNFSSAESQIKDANVAAEAANLTKAQVLEQTSVAALAQANSEPQALLKLLQ
jgi:flagellin